jgi:class 3 adenylate cyclase/tetratricopeptide (TPR) repeat protein
MRCSKCGTDNREGRKFCAKCAAPLVRLCPRCGAPNEPGEDFCGECAAALGNTSATSPKKSNGAPIQIADTPAAENLEGERKTVTMLFADIKGSMELIEDLDPEEARAIVDPALKLMMEAVQRYGGYVAQPTGDGIFALFGAPVAHEDHPQRALFAALRMQAEVKRYAEKLRGEKGVNLQVRVGANTGEVVVREIRTGKHTEYAPIGHSTGVAARLEALAEPGSIVISESMRKLVEGYFTLKPLGPARIKGISEPQEIYEVNGQGKLRTRFQRAAARGYTKFAGRQREMETMQHGAGLAKSGSGQIVAVVGEAGVGKSRLFHEFKAINQFGWMVLEAFSVSHGKATVYLPVIELLHGYFRIATEDDQRTRREKVNGRIVTLDPALEDARPYLFGLLGLVEGDDPLARMDPQVRRRRTQDAIKRILLRESLNQPVMLVFEDLHQIDGETQAFLSLLADSIGTSRILLLFNYRPEYSHSWGSKTYYTQVRLDPLGKETADEMLSTLLGNDESVAQLKRLIAEKTEGNPLFMEEIYQALIEEGVLVRNGAVKTTRPLNALKIPTTVQAILTGRIDGLPAGQKELLGTLAVIGRDFRLGLVSKVVARPLEELEEALAQLQLAEFIYEQPAAGDIEYRFKHQLTREAAYNSVLVERRKALHERVAHAIEELGAKRVVDDRLADLAYHYERSRNRAKAVDYLTRAGTQIAQRSTFPEAMQHFERALEILKEMSAGRSRDSLELRLQVMIATTATYHQGEGSADTGKASARAVELAVGPEDTTHKASALMFLCGYHAARAELRRASEVARDLFECARGTRNPEVEFWANVYTGHIAYYMGEFRKAEQFMRAAAANDTEAARWRSYALVRRSNALWCLGFPDQALALAKEAMMLGEGPDNRLLRENRYIYVAVLSYAGVTHSYAGELSQAEELFRRTLNLSTERGFALIGALASISVGLVLALRGQPQAGLEQIHRGIELISESSATFPQVVQGFGYDLARGLAYAGRPDEAFSKLIQTLEWAEQSGMKFQLAPMHQLKGRLFEGKSNPEEAEKSFHTAIEIARRQSAKSLELLATTSLARLLAKQDRRDEGRAMLAEIYNWFTEGFDTADLKDAKALLDELSR